MRSLVQRNDKQTPLSLHDNETLIARARARETVRHPVFRFLRSHAYESRHPYMGLEVSAPTGFPSFFNSFLFSEFSRSLLLPGLPSIIPFLCALPSRESLDTFARKKKNAACRLSRVPPYIYRKGADVWCVRNR